MDLVNQVFWNAVGYGARFMALYPLQAEIAVIVTIMLIIAVGYSMDQRRRGKKFYQARGKNMTRKERQLYLQLFVGDLITNALEEAEYAGKLTRSEVSHLYRKLARILAIRDLLPGRIPLEERLTAGEIDALSHMIMARKVVNIPGPLPGEDQKVVHIDHGRRKFGDKYLSRRAG